MIKELILPDIKTRAISVTKPEKISIPSSRVKGVSYEVSVQKMSCTCRDWKFRRAKYNQNDIRRICKHLLVVLSSSGYLDLVEEHVLLALKQQIDFFKLRHSHFNRVQYYVFASTHGDVLIGPDLVSKIVFVIARYDEKKQEYREFLFDPFYQEWLYLDGHKQNHGPLDAEGIETAIHKIIANLRGKTKIS